MTIPSSSSHTYGRQNANLQRPSTLGGLEAEGEASLDRHEYSPNLTTPADNVLEVTPTFRDTLQRLLPKESSIMRSIEARVPRSVFINVDEPQGVELEPSNWKNHIHKAHAGGSALIIQDINVTWADLLISDFADSLSDAFFAEHMIRVDSSLIVGKTALEALADLEELGACLRQHGGGAALDSFHLSDDWLMALLTICLEEDDKGLHVDCDISSSMERSPEFPYPAPSGKRWNVFEKHVSKESHWRSVRTQISWCQLRDHVYLVLVDGMPDISKSPGFLWKTSNENPFQELLSLGIGSKPPWKAIRSPILVDADYTLNGIHKSRSTDCVKTTIRFLLQHYTPDSVFNPQDVPSFRQMALISEPGSFGSVFSVRKVGMCHVFVWSLAASSWELVVAMMESSLQHLQRNATMMTNDEAFRLFRGFRRLVADAEILTAEFRERLLVAIKAADKWFAHDEERLIRPARFWGGNTIPPSSLAFGRTQPMNINNLPGILEDLDERVNAMAKTVNEEIQVVIGSVQVDDAKIMKRQTEVTVVLAVLAAIYLPLTLVTGIFGMNINEINQGVPDRFWVVKVWSWVSSVTVLPILIYAIVRWVIKRVRNGRKGSKDKSVDPEALKLD